MPFAAAACRIMQLPGRSLLFRVDAGDSTKDAGAITCTRSRSCLNELPFNLKAPFESSAAGRPWSTASDVSPIATEPPPRSQSSHLARSPDRDKLSIKQLQGMTDAAAGIYRDLLWSSCFPRRYAGATASAPGDWASSSSNAPVGRATNRGVIE